MIRILIVKPSSLGDVIHAAGAVRAIAEARADATLVWLVNEEYADFVREFPGVSDVLAFPRQRFRRERFGRSVASAIQWLRSVRNGRFELAVDLQGLQRSALFARASGATERFGPRNARELGWVHYTHKVRVPAERVHAIDRLEHIASRVLAESRFFRDGPREARFEHRLPVPDDARKRAQELLREAAPGTARFVALCPGTRWDSKTWPAERWIELVRGIADRHPNAHAIFLGAPSETVEIEEIVRAADVPATSFAGRLDLWATAAMLEMSAVAITLDSAPLHLASAVDTPTISLFGPTDPARVAPRSEEHIVLRRNELACLACYERRCPLPRRTCLPDLTAGDVLDRLVGVLSS